MQQESIIDYRKDVEAIAAEDNRARLAILRRKLEHVETKLALYTEHGETNRQTVGVVPSASSS